MNSQYVEKRVRVNLSLNDKEKELFSRQALKRGEKVSPFIKNLAIAQLKKQNKYIPTDDENQSIKELVRNLRAIGNNINQIAHVANVQQKSSMINFIKLRKKVADAEKLIKDYYSRKIN
ncbi:Bacterial mobilization domain protein [Candidatus Magnetomorum sp. HK-1]|nr:Bacterial mobilization domain protein [Candidatus Magnetomorum sp. HK-1]